MGTCPLITSISDWPLPLYGTCTMSTPVAALNISPLMCDWMPLPPDPKFSCPGFAFASAMSSATVFAGTEGCTTSTWPALATIDTGAKSAMGSKPRRLYRCGLVASVLELEIRMV